MIFGIKSFFLENITRHNKVNETFINQTIYIHDEVNNNIYTEKDIISEIMNNFENLCFQNLPDFNLLFLTSGIGNLFLKFLGYSISTIIFTGINVLLIFFYPSIDFPIEKYSDIYSLLIIVLYFLLLYISVGGISLFSQQIFFDGLKKYIDLKYDKEVSRNITYFYYLCSTSIISYIIYIGINYFLREYLYKNFFICNIRIFSASFGVSIIIYIIYSLSFIKVEKKKHGYSKNIYRICGYLIYREIKSLKYKDSDIIDENNNDIKKKGQEEKNINKEDKNVEKNNFEEKDKESEIKEENDKIINNNNDTKIENNEIENISSNNVINNEGENNQLVQINKIKIKKQEEEEISCVSCKLCFKKFFKGVENSDFLSMIFLCNGEKAYAGDFPEGIVECGCCDFWYIPFCLMSCCDCEDRCQFCDCCDCCGGSCYSKFCRIWFIFWSLLFCLSFAPLCFCCYCDALCMESEVNELHQDEEQFCYCYKIQRKGSWICDLLFKNNLLEIIIINVFLEILVIGFGKQIEINMKNNSIFANFLMIIIYSLFFFVITLLDRIKCFDDEGEKKFNGEIYRLFGLTIWNSFIVVIISGFSLFGNDVLKDFTNKYLILLPYAITKFYYFILMNSLVKDLDSENIDLLSNSLIISLFLLVYQVIAWIFTDLLEPNLERVYFFQFIFGLIVSIFTLSIFFFKFIFTIFLIVTCLWIVLCCQSKKPIRKIKKRRKFFFNE